MVRREDRRQSYCPTCKSVRGTPTSVAMTAEQRVISYRCPSCAAEWKISHLTSLRADLVAAGSHRRDA
jgi:hypothetical protein